MSETQTNAIDPTTAKRFVGEIDKCHDELLTLRGEYMNRCKTVRERIKDWKEQAQNAGVPRRGLNHFLKRRDLQAKLQEHEDDAEAEIVETADMIDDALGGEKGLAGSPLAAAAGGTELEDDADLRGKRQKEKEATRQSEAEERLKGMKAETAEKAKASRKKKSDALDDLAGGATH